MRIQSGLMNAQASQSTAMSGLLAKIQEKLSTGRRINRASDDAAGLSVARELEKQARGYKTAGSNIQDAMAALRIADGGSNEISSMLQRQRELAVQASNGTLNDRDRQSLNQEFRALSDEIDRISQTTQYNRQQLLDGSSPLSDGTGQIQVGSQAGDTMQMDAVNFRAVNLGVSGDISTQQGALSAISRVDSALENVNAGRSTMGARINRMESAYSNAVNTEVQTTSAWSIMEDLDFAQGLVERSRIELLGQSSISAQRQFQQISRNTLLGLLQ